MMYTGFISVEGIDGSGKSTLISALVSHYAAKGAAMLSTREPGGSDIAEKIRELLVSDLASNCHPMTELLLLYAGRMQHLEQTIKPALDRDMLVISDRFYDASYAYQVGAQGVDEKILQQLDIWVVANTKPDLTLLVDTPVHICQQRTQARGQFDRYDRASEGYFTRVREAYFDRAQQDPERIKVVDGSLDAERVLQQALAYVETALRRVVE